MLLYDCSKADEGRSLLPSTVSMFNVMVYSCRWWRSEGCVHCFSAVSVSPFPCVRVLTLPYSDLTGGNEEPWWMADVLFWEYCELCLSGDWHWEWIELWGNSRRVSVLQGCCGRLALYIIITILARVSCCLLFCHLLCLVQRRKVLRRMIYNEVIHCPRWDECRSSLLTTTKTTRHVNG